MKCDIAIVGGGLAGASLAVALAPLGFNIKVIEAVAYKASEQPSYDDRTLALSHSSCRILSGIGLWENLQADATPIRKIYIRELARPGEVLLDSAELGLAAFGQSGVERALAMLNAELKMVMGQMGTPTLADIGPQHIGMRQSRIG